MVLKRLPCMPLAGGSLWVPSLCKRQFLISTTLVLVLIKYQLLPTVQITFPNQQIRTIHTEHLTLASVSQCGVGAASETGLCANWCHRATWGPELWCSGNTTEPEFWLLACGELAPGIFLLSNHWRAIYLWHLLSMEEHSLFGEVNLKRFSPTRMDSYGKRLLGKNFRLFLQVLLCGVWILK